MGLDQAGDRVRLRLPRARCPVPLLNGLPGSKLHDSLARPPRSHYMKRLRSIIQILFLSILFVSLVAAQTAPSSAPPATGGGAGENAASTPAGEQAPSSTAPGTDQKLQQLQNKVDQLDQKLQDAQKKLDDEAAQQTPNAARVTADLSGFTIQSNDKNFLLKIGADLQADSRMVVSEGSGSTVDSFVLRRIRPTFSGTVFQYVDYFFRPDFGQGSTVIYDAYVELK